MKTNRLEAFSDGVLAIIITIMVLELKAPKEDSLNALLHELPIFTSYLGSFIYIGIYWNSHHHLFQITQKVNGKILWANLHLLFWLSLIPFATAWLGNNYEKSLPVGFYGFVLLMSAIAFTILQTTIINSHHKEFALKTIVGKRYKEKISVIFYVLGISLSIVNPFISIICYVIVPFLWLIPNKKIENEI